MPVQFTLPPWLYIHFNYLERGLTANAGTFQLQVPCLQCAKEQVSGGVVASPTQAMLPELHDVHDAACCMVLYAGILRCAKCHCDLPVQVQALQRHRCQREA